MSTNGEYCYEYFDPEAAVPVQGQQFNQNQYSYQLEDPTEHRPLLNQQQSSAMYEKALDSDLADQIIRMLQADSKSVAKKRAEKRHALKQTTTTDPTADATKDIPPTPAHWQDDLFFQNKFLVGGTFWIAVGFILVHVITFAETLELWGHSDPVMISLSVGQLICATYTLLICKIPSGKVLKVIFLLRWGFLAIYFLEVGLMVTVVLSGLYGIQIADQMGIFRISSNIVACTIIDLVPYTVLLMLTLCVIATRRWEIQDEPRDFESKADPFPWDSSKRPGKTPTRLIAQTELNIDSLTDQLLKSYLQMPTTASINPAQSAPMPQTRKTLPKQSVAIEELMETPNITIIKL